MNTGTDGAEARIGAALGPAGGRIAALAWVACGVIALSFGAFAVALFTEVGTPGRGGESVLLDFTAFWGAARLGIAGQPLAAFDPAALGAAEALPPGTPRDTMFWLYPPGWLLAVMPLGLLPFAPAWLAYSAASFGAFAAAVRPFARALPGGTKLMLAAPAVLIALILGNNSLLWTAGLLGALWALRQRRDRLAGGLIALLTLKPQLGLLIPVALVAAGRWRVVGWATLFTLVLTGATTAALGPAYWSHFLAGLGLITEMMRAGAIRFERMISWYAVFRIGGAGHGTALGAQLAVNLLTAVAVVLAWRRPVSEDLRAATLCIATPLATPYAYHYEMTLALAAAMFLLRDGFGATRAERLWLLPLWLGSIPVLVLPGAFPVALYAAPLLTATLGICLWRARGAPA